MRCRNFWPIAAILRAIHAPGANPPIPEAMKKALVSIERLDQLAEDKIARVKARDEEAASVLDDLASHR